MQPVRRNSTAGFSTGERGAAIVARMSIWSWLLLGAGTWVLAVVLKVLADVVVQRLMTAAFRDWAAAFLSGVWSSLCELGLAALAFWYFAATFADALVLALGAASAEFLVLLVGAAGANWPKKQVKSKAAAEWNAFFAERAVAFASHLSARALMWLGVIGAAGLPAAGSALGLFALTEAIQAYGQAKEWDWLKSRVLWTYLLFQMLIVAFQFALLVMWWRH